ncbi:uncharacterized protein LOC112043108 [Bicyclus anynana]|uniref:Uncharacterized protein LOC112043108 n=1 Tax=Bicyclus anynana TaxID=110368 RepID=A0A6J1MG74_BICAN|nr:uncharacterized protein LOC112043108 [Bicyclus anynana]XP_023934155.2 uncharacterized protein LOC112043108 [Bicyclus anynana]
MKVFMFTFLITTQLSTILGTPPYLPFQHKCWVSDTSCLTSKVQAIMPVISKGNLALGTEQLDPMLIDALNVNTENLQFYMTNVDVKGFKDAVIDIVSIDMISKVVQIVYHANFLVKSQYVTKGSLFGLPIFGEGDVSIKMANVEVEMTMPFDIVTDGYGRDVMDLKGYRYSFNVRDGARYDLTNLYYGDKTSSDTMHGLVNKNWKLITIKYGGYLFDLINPKVFDTIRNYMSSQALCDFVDLSPVLQK